MEYMSAKEAATFWGISARRTAILCEQGRIDGAAKVGNSWIIPKTSKKPMDARIKSGRYVKPKGAEIA